MRIELTGLRWNLWPLTWTFVPGVYADGVRRILHIGPLKIEWWVGDRGAWR